jgi:hypothetical protein
VPGILEKKGCPNQRGLSTACPPEVRPGKTSSLPSKLNVFQKVVHSNAIRIPDACNLGNENSNFEKSGKDHEFIQRKFSKASKKGFYNGKNFLFGH